jgi:hypothetical protein
VEERVMGRPFKWELRLGGMVMSFEPQIYFTNK